jgi:hypothetical protein
METPSDFGPTTIHETTNDDFLASTTAIFQQFWNRAVATATQIWTGHVASERGLTGHGLYKCLHQDGGASVGGERQLPPHRRRPLSNFTRRPLTYGLTKTATRALAGNGSYPLIVDNIYRIHSLVQPVIDCITTHCCTQALSLACAGNGNYPPILDQLERVRKALFPSSTKTMTMTKNFDKNHDRSEDEDSTKTSTHWATLITKTVIEIDPQYNDGAYTT